MEREQWLLWGAPGGILRRCGVLRRSSAHQAACTPLIYCLCVACRFYARREEVAKLQLQALGQACSAQSTRAQQAETVAAATQLRLERILAQAAAAERREQGKSRQQLQQEEQVVGAEGGLADHPYGQVRAAHVGAPGVVRCAPAADPAVTELVLGARSLIALPHAPPPHALRAAAVRSSFSHHRLPHILTRPFS